MSNIIVRETKRDLYMKNNITKVDTFNDATTQEITISPF